MRLVNDEWKDGNLTSPSYISKEERIETKKKGKWMVICQKCEYKDSSFMPCNQCDELGSQFKRRSSEG